MSQTSVVELSPLRPPPEQGSQAPETPLPAAASPLPKWNESKRQICRLFSTYWSFLILGSNDASYGPLIPYLQSYYGVDYTKVSLIFLAQVVGFVASAISMNAVHVHLGQRGVAAIGGVCQALAYLSFSLHPPFPALIVIIILIGYGEGLKNAGWNSWIGKLANANELLGLLHGLYGLGATLSPLLATVIATRKGGHWYQFFYFMVGGVIIDLGISLFAFWDRDGKAFRASTQDHTRSPEGLLEVDQATESTADAQQWKQRLRDSRTLLILKQKTTWICAAFLLAYVGSEVSLGGWIVTFMLRIRHGSKLASGLVSTGFWAGVTVGRFVLGFGTPRLFKSLKQAVTAYLVLAAIFELLFWLIPNFILSAVMVSVLGFFIAPLFPAIILVLSRVMPAHMQVPAIGFCAAIGASGAAIIPFLVGAVAQARGVQSLQPIILSMFVLDLCLWLLLPTLPKERSE